MYPEKAARDLEPPVKRLRGDDVVPCSLAMATTPRSFSYEATASLLPTWTLWVGVFESTCGGGGKIPYASFTTYAICHRHPSGPRVHVAPGPFELPNHLLAPS